VRFLEDIKSHFAKLTPPDAKYLHNGLHLRDIPPDEPENAHFYLITMMLNNSKTIFIVESKLALSTYQSILFFELDETRKRTVLI
jgi:thiamine phosphate synthase YjbQ (UPF0047 family)